jgi:hypothetical protein
VPNSDHRGLQNVALADALSAARALGSSHLQGELRAVAERALGLAATLLADVNRGAGACQALAHAVRLHLPLSSVRCGDLCASYLFCFLLASLCSCLIALNLLRSGVLRGREQQQL